MSFHHLRNVSDQDRWAREVVNNALLKLQRTGELDDTQMAAQRTPAMIQIRMASVKRLWDLWTKAHPLAASFNPGESASDPATNIDFDMSSFGNVSGTPVAPSRIVDEFPDGNPDLHPIGTPSTGGLFTPPLPPGDVTSVQEDAEALRVVAADVLSNVTSWASTAGRSALDFVQESIDSVKDSVTTATLDYLESKNVIGYLTDQLVHGWAGEKAKAVGHTSEADQAALDLGGPAPPPGNTSTVPDGTGTVLFPGNNATGRTPGGRPLGPVPGNNTGEADGENLDRPDFANQTGTDTKDQSDQAAANAKGTFADDPLEYLKNLYTTHADKLLGKQQFKDDLTVRAEHDATKRSALASFLPVAGTHELDDQDNEIAHRLKAQNLLMGQVKSPNWPLGNADNKFWVGNMANAGMRYGGNLFDMPPVMNGGTLTEGATLYGSYRSVPVPIPPPAREAGRRKYRRRQY